MSDRNVSLTIKIDEVTKPANDRSTEHRTEFHSTLRGLE